VAKDDDCYEQELLLAVMAVMAVMALLAVCHNLSGRHLSLQNDMRILGVFVAFEKNLAETAHLWMYCN
jgi:hypothetical protein